MCIGDGYIFVFTVPTAAAFFAACLAVIIENLVAREDDIEYHFRIGVHTGPVYYFWDKTWCGEPKWNYTGSGINDARRVLEAIGRDKYDVVFVSAETRSAMLADPHGDFSDGLEHLQNRGRHADKHRKLRRVYEVNHVGWANSYLV